MVATSKQVKASLITIVSLAEAIRELESVPSGQLYAQVMGTLDLPTYQSFIDRLEGAGLVSESNHLLTWIGPRRPE